MYYQSRTDARVYHFINQAEGPLKIFESPKRHLSYCMGIDTSTGLGADYSVAHIFTRQMPFRQVATFRAKWSVVDVAEFVDMLGRFYNNALAVIETNYPGNAVQDAMVQTYRYPKNYQAEEHLDSNPGVSSKYGFQTTQAKKWLLIRETQESLMSGQMILNDLVTIEEFGNFVYMEDSTKTGGSSGFNDDTVMATMLAIHGCTIYPIKTTVSTTENLPPDRAQARKLLLNFQKKLHLRGQKDLTGVNIA